MAKFIELVHFNIETNRPEGKRIINIEDIKELAPLVLNTKESITNITRVHLKNKNFIDVEELMWLLQAKIDALK